MAVAYVVWDRKQKMVVSPPAGGTYSTTAEADAVLARTQRKSGNLGRSVQNLERLTVNID